MTDNNNSSISLSWTASPQASDGDYADHYVVTRDGGDVGYPTGTFFDDDGLDRGTSYDYEVWAVDEAGNLSLTAATGTFATTDSDEFFDDFQDGNSNGWTALTPSRWSVTNDGGDYVYAINTSDYNPTPPYFFGEYSVIDESDYGDFTFSCQAKSPSTGETTYAIFFGHADRDNCCMMLFSRSSGSTRLYKFVNKVPQFLATATGTWITDTSYHNIEIVREGTAITVKRDGQLVLTATDSSPVTGQIGLGAASDMASFDDVLIVGPQSADPAEVVDRCVFYNNSVYDGNDVAANASDDGAIDAVKEALLPGGSAGMINCTAYSKGINGVMIDVENLAGSVTSGDFGIKVGTDGNPGGWSAGPSPSVSVRDIGGVSRVTLIFADLALRNTWVEVTMLANANTGLAADDVFYFANLCGECNGDGTVDGADYTVWADHYNEPGGAADFNEDGLVDGADYTVWADGYGSTLPMGWTP
jgi:hypothetical protein